MIVHVEASAARPVQLATGDGTREANLHTLSTTANSTTPLPQAAKVFDKRCDVGCELIHELPSQGKELVISSCG